MKLVKFTIFISVFILSNIFLFSEPSLAEESTTVPIQPVTLTLQNFSDLDFDIANITAKNFDANDVKNLSNHTLYAHSQETFTLNRLTYPASINMQFFTAQNEGRLTIGFWDYIERNNQALVCHDFRSQSPYYIGCSGNNSLETPAVDVNIGGILPVSQPLPIPSP
jgi:hypothetical protein